MLGSYAGQLASPRSLQRPPARMGAAKGADSCGIEPREPLGSRSQDVRRSDRTAAAMAFRVERGRGGSWDEEEITAVAMRLGLDLSLSISPAVFKSVKRRVRDDKGCLELVKDLRNRLAHGSLSFRECGEGVTVSELRDIKDRTASYLREVVSAFSFYIQRHEFLLPDRRPVEQTSA